MTKPEQLSSYVPASSLSYCLFLWEKIPFRLILKKKRQTKVGDFIWRKDQEPRISINKNLNPYSFLLTYVHEVAHLHAHQAFGRHVKSHGKEWKQTFRELMLPLISGYVFPQPLHDILLKHLKNPKASSFSDMKLTRELRNHDIDPSLTLLDELNSGTLFSIRGRTFIKGEVRRTRVKCIEMKSRREYLIRKDAAIDLV